MLLGSVSKRGKVKNGKAKCHMLVRGEFLLLSQ
jgi:hypothetical protein